GERVFHLHGIWGVSDGDRQYGIGPGEGVIKAHRAGHGAGRSHARHLEVGGEADQCSVWAVLRLADDEAAGELIAGESGVADSERQPGLARRLKRVACRALVNARDQGAVAGRSEGDGPGGNLALVLHLDRLAHVQAAREITVVDREQDVPGTNERVVLL